MFSAENANIKVLTGEEALRSMRLDIEYGGDVYAWMYLIEWQWTSVILAAQPKISRTFMIVDQKSAPQAAAVQSQRQNFTAWAWAYNRTMHDKTYIFPNAGITYIGTQNLTKGSYTMSQNRAARITHAGLAEALVAQWKEDKRRSRKILNREAKQEEAK